MGLTEEGLSCSLRAAKVWVIRNTGVDSSAADHLPCPRPPMLQFSPCLPVQGQPSFAVSTVVSGKDKLSLPLSTAQK